MTVSDDLDKTATADFSFSIGAALELNLNLDYTLTVDTEFAPQSLIAAGGMAPFTIEAVTIDPEDPEWADRYDDGTWSTHLWMNKVTSRRAWTPTRIPVWFLAPLRPSASTAPTCVSRTHLGRRTVRRMRSVGVENHASTARFAVIALGTLMVQRE